MREDNQATELMNSLAECLNACLVLCMKSSEVQRDAILKRVDDRTAVRIRMKLSEVQRGDILDAVSWFIEAAPLGDLPTVWMGDGLTKEMIRNAAAVAAQMQPLVLAWDGTTEPPESLLSLAHEFLMAIGMEQLGIRGAAP